MAITKRGRDTFLIRVYQGRDAITGKREEINVTVRGTLALAKKTEAKLKAQKESGRLIRTAKMSVNILLDFYLASIRHVLSQSTQYKYKSYLEYYVRPYVGDIPLTKINTGNIQELFNFLLDKKKEENTDNNIGKSDAIGLTPNTVKIVRNALKAAFIYAVDERLIAENPVTRTKLPPIKESRASSLTVEEAKAFVSVKDDFWYGDAFVFQLHTGLRPQELMALIWEDVDFEHGTLRIERACKWVHAACTGFGPTKSKRSNRVIGLAPDHLGLLRLHFAKQQKVIEKCIAAGSPYGEQKLEEWIRRERPKQSYLYGSARLIFPKPDGSVPTIVTPRKEFKTMLERAGISASIRWYDLRHTHASVLLAMNEPHHEVAERMGHSVTVLQNTYAHVLPGRRSSGPALFASLIPVKSD
jgi:integrase